MRKFNFIDLFAGCGGLSEGFYQTGYNSLAHVEIDSTACKTLRTRMNYYKYKDSDIRVLEKDITEEDILEKLDYIIDKKEIDVIIGGPPCQAYSSLGRAKDKDSMQNDPRNYLFESYVKILNHYLPKFFVFENVIGLLTAKIKGKYIFDKIVEVLSENYNIITNPNIIVLNSVNYGVPQIRKRVIIIGVRKDINFTPNDIYESIKKTHYAPDDSEIERKKLKKYITVREAIEELPPLLPGDGNSLIEFISKNDNEFLKKITSAKSTILRDHVARNHNDKDIERYKYMSKNKWTFTELLEKRKDLEHPKKRVFNNSYTVQWWDLPSKTIIAHLYKDGNQFIHPDYRQGRTLTVREVARLQSFPDDFIFEGPRTEQYKQIGNAVPPFLAKAIAKAIKEKLKKIEGDKQIDI